VYGPRQDPASPYSGVISIFAENLIAGRPLTVFGDGEQSRDFVFVADVVAALIGALDRQDNAAHVFNVCRGEHISLRHLISALERVSGRRAIVRHAPARPGDARHSQGDPARIRASFGFAVRVGIEEGLAALLAWLESAREIPAERGGAQRCA
jgi:UDP-glucose 4-epimerase